MRKPRIGITPDIVEGRVVLSRKYLDAVEQAGGLPFVLSPYPEQAAEYVAACDGVVLSGGADVIMEDWDQVTHEEARPVNRLRQDFERAMITALESVPDQPVLGICLGMQLMGIEHGAAFDQHLPDRLVTADEHLHDAEHQIEGSEFNGVVTSHHHQALRDGGRLTVIARAHDGVVEGIAAPDRKFYMGVQWHPERTSDEALGIRLFERLIAASQ